LHIACWRPWVPSPVPKKNKIEKYLIKGEEVAQTMYTHVRKCNNDKINKKEKYLIEKIIF
jgi:hypothetical protein